MNKIDDNYKEENNKMTFEYDEILGKSFYWYPNDSIFIENESSIPQVKDLNPFTYKNINENKVERRKMRGNNTYAVVTYLGHNLAVQQETLYGLS